MTLEELSKARREEILKVCAKYGAHNVRVFGSIARSEADEQSDIDFLAELEPGRTPGPGRAAMRFGAAPGVPGGCGHGTGSQAPYPRAYASRGTAAMRDRKERVRDILEAIAAIEPYRDRDRSAFEQDELLQVWFLRHLQIIGEAARRPPEEVRNLAPDIPSRKIIGVRNILV